MLCTRCNSQRVLYVNASCKDLAYLTINDATHDGYVPTDLGIGSSRDEVEFNLCLDCGQVQGTWPLPLSRLEKKYAKKSAIKESQRSPFADSIVEHVTNTNDGDVAALLGLILDRCKDMSTNDMILEVSQCINALADNSFTRGMSFQLQEILESWEHWEQLEPLLDTDEDQDWEEEE